MSADIVTAQGTALHGGGKPPYFGHKPILRGCCFPSRTEKYAYMRILRIFSSSAGAVRHVIPSEA